MQSENTNDSTVYEYTMDLFIPNTTSPISVSLPELLTVGSWGMTIRDGGISIYNPPIPPNFITLHNATGVPSLSESILLQNLHFLFVTTNTPSSNGLELSGNPSNTLGVLKYEQETVDTGRYKFVREPMDRNFSILRGQSFLQLNLLKLDRQTPVKIHEESIGNGKFTLLEIEATTPTTTVLSSPLYLSLKFNRI